MRWLRQIAAFLKALAVKPKAPGGVADSPELELERERKRGMRGL